MSTRFVRQFIKMFPTKYMEYVNAISNFESDIETSIINSNKDDMLVTCEYHFLRISVTVHNEMITHIKINTPDNGVIETDCSFRVNTFMEIFDTLLIMVLLPSQKQPDK